VNESANGLQRRQVCLFPLLGSILATALIIQPCAAGAEHRSRATFNVRDYGAAGDGTTLDTQAIQNAIDACARAGGGRVYLQGGTFLSGTVVLQSNVTLYVEAGATLRGSRNMEDYPDITPQIHYLYRPRFTKYMIYAERAENIGIAGRGTIDGQGKFYTNPHGDKLRPYIVRFAECKNVRVSGVTFLNSARWLSHYLACEDVVIDGIKIDSRIRENRDGIDIDSCRFVRIANCHVFTGDDAIVLKATAHRKCQHVTVTNCVLSSQASAVKLGTESNGGFEDITCTNCTIYDTGYSAIGLMMVDGAQLGRVTVSNITMRNVHAAIFIRLGNRARPLPDEEKPGMGSLRDIIISNLQGSVLSKTGCSITGIEGHYAENITLENIRLRFEGGGTQEDAGREIPEREDAYPSGKMFGTLPAYGLYCRHVKNLRLHNIDLDVTAADHRPAIRCDDVLDLDLFGLRAAVSPESAAAVQLNNVRGALIHGCRPHQPMAAFVRVRGEQSGQIAFRGNDLRLAKQPVVQSDDVPDGAVDLGTR
jgi:hypothetical protein